MKLEVDVEAVARSIPLMSAAERAHLLRALQLAGARQELPTRPIVTLDQRAYARTGYDRLTAREKQVLALIVSGQSNKSIALLLHISPRTVEVHRVRVLEKMGARNAVELCNLTTALDDVFR